MQSLQVATEAWKRLWENGKETTTTRKTNTRKTKKSKTKNKTNNARRGKQETIQSYYQRTLKGRNLDKADVEAFGDTIYTKEEETFRVGFQNIQYLSENAKTAKSRQLISYIVQKQYDVFMMAEVGLCWSLLSMENQWFERTFGKFRAMRACFAYNKTELGITKRLQTGGVGIVATDDVVHRIVEQGRDTTGLGRWAWIKLQGRQGTTIRIVTVYRPCDSTGPETANQQHQRYLTQHN
jgi:hypothetical protein